MTKKCLYFLKGPGGGANSWFEISNILKILLIWGNNGQIWGKFFEHEPLRNY